MRWSWNLWEIRCVNIWINSICWEAPFWWLPIFNEEGIGEYFLPEESAGCWTDFFTGEKKAGGKWYSGKYGYCEIPLFVRPNTILPLGAREDGPDYDYADQVALRIYELKDEASAMIFDKDQRRSLRINAKRQENVIEIQVEASKEFTVELINIQAKKVSGAKMKSRGRDTILYDCAADDCIRIEF